ncbi:TetR/AcrR family transcriptional regulator [Catenulispora rubra]|uniref:TetR/AcrR family transcriptional regulator n=1 Tax=Catenulispora rubra TaxID=280293 RepID=UPI001892188C|nr:TetR/AcrR family transcriptional regulator [Catenulispora rubra]
MTTNRREEILDAAVEVFAERGYRGASFDAIAERAGLTRQGVLHYFPSKKKLMVAILQHREDLARRHLVEHLGQGQADEDEDVPGKIAEIVAFDHLNPALTQVYSMLMAESIVQGDGARQDIQNHYRTLLEYMTEQIAVRYGPVLGNGLTPRAAATAMIVMLDGIQQQWLLNQDETDYPTIMRDVMSVVLGPKPG